MRFNVVVMQYNGEVADRGLRTLAKVQATSLGRQLVAGFGLMLEEHLPQLAEVVVKVSMPVFDDCRGELVWRQPDFSSSLAAFFIIKALRFTWFFLSGHDPVAEAAAMRATEDFIKKTAGTHVDPGATLRGLAERPLAICVPWPPSASDLERRIVGNLAVCLGAAFFKQAAEALRSSMALCDELARHSPRRDINWSDN